MASYFEEVAEAFCVADEEYRAARDAALRKRGEAGRCKCDVAGECESCARRSSAVSMRQKAQVARSSALQRLRRAYQKRVGRGDA